MLFSSTLKSVLLFTFVVLSNSKDSNYNCHWISGGYPIPTSSALGTRPILTTTMMMMTMIIIGDESPCNITSFISGGAHVVRLNL